MRRKSKGIGVYSLNEDNDLWFHSDPSVLKTFDRNVYITRYGLAYPLSDDDTMLMNTLSGAIDIVRGIPLDTLRRIISNSKSPPWAKKMKEYFFRRGYLFPSKIEEARCVRRIASVRKGLKRPLHAVLVLTTDCNFACYYCSEGGLLEHHGEFTLPQLSACLDSIERIQRQNNYIFTNDVGIGLYGGEPLLHRLKDHVAMVCERARKNGYMLNITTNGYTLLEYVPLLKEYKENITNILVTLDGPEAIHNRRRILREDPKANTFKKIVAGIDAAIAAGLHCLINSNIDRKNQKAIRSLRNYFRRKGWLDNEYVSFAYSTVTDFSKHQSYMLSQPEICQLSETCSDIPELYNSIHASKMTHHIHEVLQGRGHDSLPMVIGCSSNSILNLAFHPDSNIYGCSMLACAQRHPLGRFWPKIKFSRTHLKEYEAISSTRLRMCRNCKYLFLCGGPCPARYLMRDRQINERICLNSRVLDEHFFDFIERSKKQFYRVLKSRRKPDLTIPRMVLNNAKH